MPYFPVMRLRKAGLGIVLSTTPRHVARVFSTCRTGEEKSGANDLVFALSCRVLRTRTRVNPLGPKAPVEQGCCGGVIEIPDDLHQSSTL